VDFGIGVMGNNNLVEANSASGNSNGIVIFPSAGGNAIRQNVAVGNPPIQQSNSVTTVPAGGGVDIWDQSPPGTNSIAGNMCVTAINAPCPNLNTQATPRKPGS
jgi:parallel beta-helix repeat protein